MWKWLYNYFHKVIISNSKIDVNKNLWKLGTAYNALKIGDVIYYTNQAKKTAQKRFNRAVFLTKLGKNAKMLMVGNQNQRFFPILKKGTRKMPNFVKSLVSKKLTTQKYYLVDGTHLTKGTQNTSNISAVATDQEIKDLSDHIGFFMKATSDAEQPSTAYLLNKYLLQETEMNDVDASDAPIVRDAESARAFARRWDSKLGNPDQTWYPTKKQLIIEFFLDNGNVGKLIMDNPKDNITAQQITDFTDDFIDCGAFAFQSGDDLWAPAEVKQAYYHNVMVAVIMPGGGE